MARDQFHYIVREALEKDGWTITADPFIVQGEGIKVSVDLAADRVIAAQKGKEKIAVEIKCFTETSMQYAFYAALGQYLSYLFLLQEEHPERKLYLAIPESTYNDFMDVSFYQKKIKLHNISLIIYNQNSKKIVKWENR